MQWGQPVDTTVKWFAWHPVRVLEGRTVWLETVWRTRLSGAGSDPWRYELTPPREWRTKQGVRIVRGYNNAPRE